MTEPLINWLSFLGFLGVVLAVIYGYWKLLDWLFDWMREKRMRAEAADEAARTKLQQDIEQEIRKTLNAAISWKVKPR